MGELTQDRLKELLHYDPETGHFTRLKRVNNQVAGKVCNSRCSEGYIKIAIDGKRYAAHRLAFFYMTGEWPAESVDHKNLDTSDNSWSNLRECTQSQNLANREKATNNTLGVKNVYPYKLDKFRVVIDSKSYGVYNTLDEAEMVARVSRYLLYGEFARG